MAWDDSGKWTTAGQLPQRVGTDTSVAVAGSWHRRKCCDSWKRGRDLPSVSTMEWEAAEKLLLSLFSKRREQSSLKGMTELVHWAQKKGHLLKVVLIFSIDEWWDIGDHMWDSVINGGKEEKMLRTLGPLWRSIINTLKAVQAE